MKWKKRERKKWNFVSNFLHRQTIETLTSCVFSAHSVNKVREKEEQKTLMREKKKEREEEVDIDEFDK
jgi:hypothetical protein